MERLQSWLHADSSSPVVEFDNCLHTFDLLLNYLTILNEVMSCRHLDGSPARRLQLANNIDCAQLLLLLDGPNNGSYAIPSWALILGTCVYIDRSIDSLLLPNTLQVSLIALQLNRLYIVGASRIGHPDSQLHQFI